MAPAKKPCKAPKKFSVKRGKCLYPRCPKGQVRYKKQCMPEIKSRRMKVDTRKSAYQMFAVEELQRASREYRARTDGSAPWSFYFSRALAPWKRMSAANKKRYQAKADTYNSYLFGGAD